MHSHFQLHYKISNTPIFQLKNIIFSIAYGGMVNIWIKQFSTGILKKKSLFELHPATE